MAVLLKNDHAIKSSVGFGKYSISSFLTRASQGISESFPNVHKHKLLYPCTITSSFSNLHISARANNVKRQVNTANLIYINTSYSANERLSTVPGFLLLYRIVSIHSTYIRLTHSTHCFIFSLIQRTKTLVNTKTNNSLSH